MLSMYKVNKGVVVVVVVYIFSNGKHTFQCTLELYCNLAPTE